MSRQLLDAAAKGDLKKLRACLDGGADVQWHKKGLGRTALSEAAINGHLEIAQLLLQRGADLHWADTTVGFTPLGWAIECDHVALAKFFLDAGADPNLTKNTFQLTPLMTAAAEGNQAAVNLLLAAGADVNAVTTDERTALTIARTRKQTVVVKILEKAGAAEISKTVPTRIPWPNGQAADRDLSEPQNTLRGFIVAMHGYEIGAAKRQRSKKTENASADLAAMNAVMEVYCTAKDRPFGRHGSFRIPPEYNLEKEALIEINHPRPNRAELLTRVEDEERECLYVLLKKKGTWLLDSKKIRLVGGDWIKARL